MKANIVFPLPKFSVQIGKCFDLGVKGTMPLPHPLVAPVRQHIIWFCWAILSRQPAKVYMLTDSLPIKKQNLLFKMFCTFLFGLTAITQPLTIVHSVPAVMQKQPPNFLAKYCLWVNSPTFWYFWSKFCVSKYYPQTRSPSPLKILPTHCSVTWCCISFESWWH